jgi:hypothetical protein
MLLGAVTTDPLINILLAAGLTWAAHSSVTVALLVMAFAAQAVVPPHAAFALMLGANLGTALNALLIAQMARLSRDGPLDPAPRAPSLPSCGCRDFSANLSRRSVAGLIAASRYGSLRSARVASPDVPGPGLHGWVVPQSQLGRFRFIG